MSFEHLKTEHLKTEHLKTEHLENRNVHTIIRTVSSRVTANLATLEQQIFETLEQEYGHLQRIGGGFQSRVYAVIDTAGQPERIIKVFREAIGLNRLEAFNMVRAGFGDWVLGARNLNGLELLEIRHLPGKPLGAADMLKAIPGMTSFLHKLHAHVGFEGVNLAGVRAKLERFRRTLTEPDHEPLFGMVRSALQLGTLEVEARLCHLDLHSANILMTEVGRVFVVDWTRSDWDDPARDLAIFTTGTLDQLEVETAFELGFGLAKTEGVEARFGAYIALQTLNDLHWFRTRNPSGYEQAHAIKLPRALKILELFEASFKFGL
jgi:Phosphotransferase enzyme family